MIEVSEDNLETTLEWLQDIDTDRERVKRVIPILSNWMKLQKKINEFSEEDLRLAMAYEFNRNGRPDVVQRLKGRFNKLRHERESSEIICELARKGVYKNRQRRKQNEE